MKTCSKCGVPKEEKDFSFRKDRKVWESSCKVCESKQRKKSYQDNRESRLEAGRKYCRENREAKKEYNKKYYPGHRDAILRRAKEYYQANRGPILDQVKKYALENRGDKREYNKKYYQNNLQVRNHYNKRYYYTNQQAILEQKKVYVKQNAKKIQADVRRRRREDPSFRLAGNLRGRINNALFVARAKKSARTVELLGCPIVWLEAWLESLFKSGMTRENHGSIWHVDHIKPCAAFDLTDPEQQKICFHWSNQQPLFVKENLSKGAKYSG